jgi:high-affinity Fe2+/Pb2+ permease
MDDYGSALGAKIILSIFSVILLFPCYWALGGIYHALTVDSPSSHEGFIVAALMVLYSVVVWLPYLIYLYISRRQTSAQFKLISSIPLFILVCCFVVAL